MTEYRGSTLAAWLLAFIPVSTQAEAIHALPTLYVDAQQTANVRPVATYESPVSNLEFEPRIDLQSRNMAEAQGDVTIRGGIFENTGFRVGSATLVDPQTGHYFAELPIAPEMLTQADILIGVDNALYGFNSTVGSIDYGWSQVADGGSFTLGGGDHNLNFQRIHHGMTGAFNENGNWFWGVEAEFSRSESDGTIRFGDHDFNRTTGRVQILGPNSQTDFFAGYQAKFFGWPELYAAPFGSNESENLKTRLFLINHSQSYGENSEWEATLYTRRHSDFYLFNRNDPSDRRFLHETKVHSAAIAGEHGVDSQFKLAYAAQITADEIESNSLAVDGPFRSRTQYKVSVLPEYTVTLKENESLILSAGASFDNTNRNDSEFSPIAQIEWLQLYDRDHSNSFYLSYAKTAQYAGYTAIGSAGGLFKGNPEPDNETSQNVELGAVIRRPGWSLEASAFYRIDDDLLDWTYSFSDPRFRAANNVDIDTFGIELIGTKRWKQIEAIASYTFLEKSEDYGATDIDASFYALNFANQRVTLGAIWRPCEMLEVRIDNEWRDNEENVIREGSDSAFFTHFGLSVYPPQIDGLELFLAVDNAWDDDFEDVPGTPGRGDQYSAGATFRW